MRLTRTSSTDSLRSLCSSGAQLDVPAHSGWKRIGSWISDIAIAITVALVSILLIVPTVVLFILACVRMGRTDPMDACQTSKTKWPRADLVVSSDAAQACSRLHAPPERATSAHQASWN